jgi:hypothetical protein
MHERKKTHTNRQQLLGYAAPNIRNPDPNDHVIAGLRVVLVHRGQDSHPSHEPVETP